jgi:hypothetical protein
MEKVKGALYHETRRNSRGDSTGRSTGDTRLTVEPGCLVAEDRGVRLASADITAAKRRAGDATETVSVDSRNLEDSLAMETSVQGQRPSHPQDDSCEQSCEANATSAGSAPRRLETSSEIADLSRGQENTNLFVSELDPPSLHSSQSQQSGSGTTSGGAACRTASLNLATSTAQGGSVTAELIADGTDGGSRSFTASTSPDVVNAASNHGPASSFQPSRDTVFETTPNSQSSDNFEANEHNVLPHDLPPHSSFFEEEYDATMAGRSPELFSHNCPSCIGPCVVGRAPENWTGVELDLLHKRLLEARSALEVIPSVTDSQSAAWVDGFHGANIFFAPHVLQSCEKSDADAYSFTLDALKCLAADNAVLDRPTIVRRPDDWPNVDIGSSAPSLRHLIETHICLVGNRWLRSLRRTHLCMIPSQVSMCNGGQVTLHPRANSRAIFLDATDILFIPKGTPAAVFTFEDSLLQSGTIRNRAHSVQLRAHELVGVLEEILAMPASLVRL